MTVEKIRAQFRIPTGWRVEIDICGMLHVGDPSGASAKWAGDGTQLWGPM